MLECAASDIYTQCGMKRLICVSRIDDFVVPHLSNKNSLRWGLPQDEFDELTRSLQRLAQNGGWRGSLFEVDTKMPRGMWSKNLYERPDEAVLGMMPGDAKTVLSVGSGWGVTENFLAKRGKQVTALPVDGVFADCARRRNIEVIEGPIESAVSKLGERRFECVLMPDMIQLLEDPVRWLSLLRPLLAPAGIILASAPRTFDPLRVSWYLRGEPAAVFPKEFALSGVQKVTRRRLLKWFAEAGLAADICATCNTPTRIGMLAKMQGMGDHLLADRFIVRAKSKIEP
jgi:2-polyprenyl-3-methyl-5-hydroxy-6-metoxy-1,4-benzoquinol methylase